MWGRRMLLSNEMQTGSKWSFLCRVSSRSKFGYAMNEWVQKNLLDEKLISKELIEKYNKEWDEAYDAIYNKKEGDD
jgi:hypothetical protein